MSPAFTLCVACDEAAPEAPLTDSPADEQDDARRLNVEDGERLLGGKLLAEVELDGGAQLTFISLGHGENNGVGMLERVPGGAIGLADVPEMHGQNVLDIFWAVTEPGTAVPGEFKLALPDAAPSGQQGWLLDHLANTDIVKPRTVCISNTAVQSWLTQFGYDDRLFIKYDEEPTTSTVFFEYPNDWGGSWSPAPTPTHWEYSANGVSDGHTYGTVDRYATIVNVCALGSHPNLTTSGGFVHVHPGPDIYISYHHSGMTGWDYAVFEDVPAADVGENYTWVFNSGTNWDWKTEVREAEQNDLFDIAHAGEDL